MMHGSTNINSEGVSVDVGVMFFVRHVRSQRRFESVKFFYRYSLYRWDISLVVVWVNKKVERVWTKGVVT
jgi:hypothetical protein